VREIALGLELHEVRTGPPLKSVQVTLDSILSIQPVDSSTQLGVISKSVEGAFRPTVRFPDKDVK